MAEDRRTKVPPARKGQVIFDSDSRCCVCQAPGDQVHHIDGKSWNHEGQNLAFLCFSCHDKASKTGGLSSKLPIAAIRKYRDHWHEVVRVRREGERRGPLVDSKDDGRDFGQMVLDKLALMEVRRTTYLTADEWEGDEPSIQEHRIRRMRLLKPYTYGYGIDVRAEVLEALHELVGPWSWRTPRELAETMAELIEDAIAFAMRTSVPPTKPEVELLARGARLALDISYNAGRYMEDLAAVRAGCNVLERVLRAAFLRGDSASVEAMQTQFINVMENSFADGKEWIRFAIGNALRPAGTPDLEPPQDLLNRLWACQELPSPVLKARMVQGSR